MAMCKNNHIFHQLQHQLKSIDAIQKLGIR